MNNVITSLSNPLVKKVVSLHSRKGRAEHGQFIVEGSRMIEAFLQAGKKPMHFFFSQQASQEILDGLGVDENLIIEVPQNVMEKMSAALSPSGYLAVFSQPEFSNLSSLKRNAIVLSEIHDPGNMGTLIRTAVSLNFSVVILGGVDCWSPKVVQSSAGALAYAEIIKTGWRKVKEFSATQSYLLLALVVKNGIMLEKSSINSRCMLVVGSEAHGLQEEVIQECDEQITLAMPGNTESLNASIAGSIAMYIVYQKLSGLL